MIPAVLQYRKVKGKTDSFIKLVIAITIVPQRNYSSTQVNTTENNTFVFSNKIFQT